MVPRTKARRIFRQKTRRVNKIKMDHIRSDPFQLVCVQGLNKAPGPSAIVRTNGGSHYSMPHLVGLHPLNNQSQEEWDRGMRGFQWALLLDGSPGPSCTIATSKERECVDVTERLTLLLTI